MLPGYNLWREPMADLIYATPTDGVARVINLDHVVQIREMPQGMSEMTFADGNKLTFSYSASQLHN